MHDSQDSNPNFSRSHDKTSTPLDEAGFHQNPVGPQLQNASTLNAVSACQSNLLATALLRVEASNGNSFVARALLDWGATTSFVTLKVAKQLGLDLTPVNVAVSGIQGVSTGPALGMVDFAIKATKNGDGRFTMNISALVLSKLTSLIPQRPVKVKPWTHIAGLPLADPNYFVPGEIDIILGIDVCGMLILEKSKRGGEDEPIARQTPLGLVH